MIYQETTCIKELLAQYEQTLKRTKIIIAQLELEMESYEKIQRDKNYSQKERMLAKEELETLIHDKNIYSSIRNDLEYTIHWMKTGHQPENKRGIERRAAYQREKPFDPLIMQRFFRSTETVYSWDVEIKENSIGRSDKERINEALSILTDKEREFYLMSKGNSLTFTQIAKQFKVKKSTVSNTIYRAEKKIGKYLANQKEGVS